MGLANTASQTFFGGPCQSPEQVEETLAGILGHDLPGAFETQVKRSVITPRPKAGLHVRWHRPGPDSYRLNALFPVRFMRFPVSIPVCLPAGRRKRRTTSIKKIDRSGKPVGESLYVFNARERSNALSLAWRPGTVID
jgi:hypothetical protein